ncbi:hypothetical protein BKA70DRAFT_1301972 [Coprinopsis sp. MPI-PUGE-AT-0042]|nr:hypothetical protein BKA70DRAFT_1301972 [Coprinopsis sp. MPI-PUGE-AT-0042]
MTLPVSPFFATVVVHNSRRTGSDDPRPLVLRPSVSFPAPPYTLDDKDKPLPASWAPKETACADGRLELRLLDFIAEGRISTVYAATVVSATQQGLDITPNLPKKFCIKFAKKHSCRSLARDAWFYEQLQDWQGIMTAQSYGFYTSNANEQPNSPKTFLDEFTPWQNHRVPVRYDSTVADWGISMDWLPDDRPCVQRDYIDAADMKANSLWNLWAVDEANPVIAAYIMELPGDVCDKSRKQKEIRPDLQKEILEVVDDMNHAGVYHSDVSAWNVLQSNDDEGNDATRLCPRHNTVHKWRIFDFDRARMVDRANTAHDSEGIWALTYFDKNEVGRDTTFWGIERE